MVKSRGLAHCSTLYNIRCFSSLLTRQPIPCDRLMDVPKGALILFCQGLAVTQGLFSINKQEWRKWQPSRLPCTAVIFSRRIAYLHLLIYLARAKKRSTTHLLSAGIISSYSAAERARCFVLFLTASPQKRSWLEETEGKYTPLNETRVSCSVLLRFILRLAASSRSQLERFAFSLTSTSSPLPVNLPSSASFTPPLTCLSLF